MATTHDLDPLATSTAINDSYQRYLQSTFAPQRAALAGEFDRALSSFRLANGPFLQASPPYETGASLERLVDEGVLHPGFRRLSSVFPASRSLYAHQEEAIRKAVAGRNLIVATGTGSGKTECFVFPILQHLLREQAAGSLAEPGVRAMLLYPMNALANDQLKRLRELLAPFPEITFGRYVGDTKQVRSDALETYRQRFGGQPLPNELISRQEMQERPPHILLTNYAMLEYLLLRPADSSFFDGTTGRHWRYVVLDEVHVYDGARGAELGMLLRRVKDRVHHSEPGKLQCIGTSATLGRGDEALPRLTAFGETVFGERFVWDWQDPLEQDIVQPQRKPLVSDEARYSLPPAAFDELRSAALAEDLDRCSGALRKYLPSAEASARPGEEIGPYLHRVLSREQHVVAVQQALEEHACDLRALASEVFGEASDPAALVALIDLSIRARPSATEAPLVPARYHLMVRALEGAFVCLAPDHPAEVERLTLARHKECGPCGDHGHESPVFELGVCRRCGADYVLGREVEGYLRQAPPTDWDLLYLLIDEPVDGEDEDEAAVEGELPERQGRQTFCTSCGALSDQPRLDCCASPAPVSVTVARPALNSPDLRRCLACGGRSNTSIVYRFLTGADAPVAVVATSLYQSLADSSIPEMRSKIGGGRKLLSFADSRQDAAFFAPYLDRTYGRAVERRLIWDYLQRHPDDDAQFDDMVTPIRKAAERALVLDPDSSGPSRTVAVQTWLTREVLATDRRQSLEGVGLAEITVCLPRGLVTPQPLLDLGFDDDEAKDLCRVLLDTLRLSAAVHLPEGVDIKDPAFSPRNVVTVVREQGSEYSVLSWIPGKGSNRRVDYLAKLFARRNITADPKQLLSGLWTWFTDPNGPWARTLLKTDHRKHGTVFALSYERIQFLPVTPEHTAFRCDTCRQITWRSVSGTCPSYRCPGQLHAVPIDEMAHDHYRTLYTDLEPVGMRVEEHTGQLAADYAGELQEQFIRGDVNVLSCSTTFELGVDVGEVQAVLMRNVPPRPSNYVQRAGRAGRRLGAAALVVTFAQRRNHDLHYFSQPHDLIEGVVAPPIVTIENLPIARRHAHAVAFAAYERRVVDAGGDPHKLVEQFFEPVGAAAVDDFIQWLSSEPASLHDALTRIVPPALLAEVGIDDWSWVTRLVQGTDEGFGWLARARDELQHDLAEVRAAVEEAKAENNLRYGAALQDLYRTLSRRQLIDYLAQRVVLPKYGFPVDVVELDVNRAGDRDAARLELQRDLRTAIVEFAPGAQLVADKSLWQPTGLKKPPGRALLKRQWNECPVCGAFATWLSERPAGCPKCGDGSPASVKGRAFIQPIFGFVGRRSDEKPGESRPPKAGSAHSYFDEYEGAEPVYEPVSLGGAGVLECRSSRQGRITSINKGRGGNGFQVCRSCGSANESTGFGKGAPKPHKKPFNSTSDCTSMYEYVHLGHQYLTDVVELRLPPNIALPNEVALSVLYSVLHGARAVGVAPSDVDGTVRTIGPTASTLVVFDAVPGGAGHAMHIAKHIEHVLREALAIVAECECGEETSCYACLRSYSNQTWHDVLSRGAARDVLTELLGIEH
jgi:ATP-dependent helicase YprA (DUF1998 family)